jgi:protein gp37
MAAKSDIEWIDATWTPVRVGKKVAGRLLDGRTWDQCPKVVA